MPRQQISEDAEALMQLWEGVVIEKAPRCSLGESRSLSEYSQIAESREMEFSSVFASMLAMESSTPDGGLHGIEFS
jgi:hypothetical protein